MPPLSKLHERDTRLDYPFAAIVGQSEMKLALLLNLIAPTIGGVLIMGHRGTGKSTAVRALADLLPPINKVRDCVYGCDPADESNLCAECFARQAAGEKLPREKARVPVVDLPLGATEDRVCGTIDIERAISNGVKSFDPGLLARANRGFLYIDEVNLLEDHLIDLLLDACATGRNVVEREGISISHPARFVLVGSGNPEEGELRPQLTDRFGLHVEVKTIDDLPQRIEIVESREAFERDPENFRASFEDEQERLRRKLTRARKILPAVVLSHELLEQIARLCLHLRVDGHRGELTITRAARALAAFEGRRKVSEQDVRRVAVMSLRHRLRRDPLELSESGARIEQALDEIFPPDAPTTGATQTNGRDGGGSRGDQGKGGSPQKFTRAANNKKDSKTGESVDEKNSAQPDDERKVLSSLDARLPDAALDHASRELKRAAPSKSQLAKNRSSKRSAVSRAYQNAPRGRYTRAVTHRIDGAKIALDATLRAATQDQPAQFPVQIDASALRFKNLKRKAGTLFILAVDASGSMALNRIAQAKGALAHILQKSYVRRDRIALISFRQQSAEILLPPSQSAPRARRLLDALAVGGATPLAAGLARAIEIIERERKRGAQTVTLLIFTDGRANVALGNQETANGKSRNRIIEKEIEKLGAILQRSKVATVVIDTQNRFTSSGEGQALASRLGARYVYLPDNAQASATKFPSREFQELISPNIFSSETEAR